MSSPASKPLADRVDAALPQTQCRRCGYPDCAGYAQAIADGEAAINQCPPGGAEGVERLAGITRLPLIPLNPAHGSEAPRAVAVIDEAWCIGCTLCLAACPVDAITGSNKLMHTVLEAWCTGCELCVPACPVDCISLENVTGIRTGWNAWSTEQAQASRTRYAFHSQRLASPQASGLDTVAAPTQADDQPGTAVTATASAADAPGSTTERKRAMIEAAMARARAQREQPDTGLQDLL